MAGQGAISRVASPSVALTLTVDRAAWDRHVDTTLAAHPGVLPVVKGNGYGFGRPRAIAALRARGITSVAVGTVFEVPDGFETFVLTPAVGSDASLLPADAIPTVGSLEHVGALVAAGWSGRVLVKLASSMRRYGATPDGLPTLLDAVRAAGFAVDAYSLHLPLAPSAANLVEALAWLPHLGGAPSAALHVSHLDAEDDATLRVAAGGRIVRQRVGTRLWLGDRTTIHLSADVLDVRAVRAGEPVGYRATPNPHDGTLVMIGAGTAHGVFPLPDGRSPFHFARRRLVLVEPPHMHTSIVVVPHGENAPDVGAEVDVQRPLTQTYVDRVVDR